MPEILFGCKDEAAWRIVDLFDPVSRLWRATGCNAATGGYPKGKGRVLFEGDGAGMEQFYAWWLELGES